jgi:putative ABC transport system permease protein
MILVSCMLMVITWINYINLLAVQINDRSREIAIRKSMGERPVNLYVQSSLVILVFNLSASLLSIGLVTILTPLYHQVFEMAESTILFTSSAYWVWIGLLLLADSMVAGIYPSLLCA